MSHSYLIQPDLTRDPDDYTIPIPFTFSLDPFQKHAICAIQKEHNVLVCAKTGSGKTLVGEYWHHTENEVWQDADYAEFLTIEESFIAFGCWVFPDK